MATNLFIANADIPLASSGAPVLGTPAATGFPVANLFGGNKTDIFKNTGVSGSSSIRIDLAAAKTFDFLYIGKADLLKKDVVTTVEVFRNTSNTFGTATSVLTASSFGSATLYGPRSEDYIATVSETSAFQYWWVNYTSSATSYLPHAKLFFGKAFDMGRDPGEGATLKRVNPGVAQRDPYYQVELSWTGISYANTVLFYNTFVRPRRYNPVILFTKTYHGILNDHRVLFGRITDATMPPRVTDFNDISITFEEVI